MHILVWWLWIPLYTSPLRDTILRFPIFQASLLHDQVPSAILWCTAAALDISWYNHDSQPPDLQKWTFILSIPHWAVHEHFRLTVSPFNLSHVTRKKCVCVCAHIRLCPCVHNNYYSNNFIIPNLNFLYNNALSICGHPISWIVFPMTWMCPLLFCLWHCPCSRSITTWY